MGREVKPPALGETHRQRPSPRPEFVAPKFLYARPREDHTRVRPVPPQTT